MFSGGCLSAQAQPCIELQADWSCGFGKSGQLCFEVLGKVDEQHVPLVVNWSRMLFAFWEQIAIDE